MRQINVHVAEEFAGQISRLVRLGSFPSRSEAIRAAVRESLERRMRRHVATDFSSLRALARPGRENPKRRFRSDDDLWR